MDREQLFDLWQEMAIQGKETEDADEALNRIGLDNEAITAFLTSPAIVDYLFKKLMRCALEAGPQTFAILAGQHNLKDGIVFGAFLHKYFTEQLANDVNPHEQP